MLLYLHALDTIILRHSAGLITGFHNKQIQVFANNITNTLHILPLLCSACLENLDHVQNFETCLFVL